MCVRGRAQTWDASDVGCMDEVVREFLVESYENLNQLDQDLAALAGNGGSREPLSRVFRNGELARYRPGRRRGRSTPAREPAVLEFSRLERLTRE